MPRKAIRQSAQLCDNGAFGQQRQRAESGKQSVEDEGGPQKAKPPLPRTVGEAWLRNSPRWRWPDLVAMNQRGHECFHDSDFDRAI